MNCPRAGLNSLVQRKTSVLGFTFLVIVLALAATLLAPTTLAAQTKCGSGWCLTFPVAGQVQDSITPPFGSSAWNKLNYIPDEGRFFIYTSDGIYTFSNSWWSYGYLGQVATQNPFVKESTSGSKLYPLSTTTSTKGFLAHAIATTDTTIVLNAGQGSTFHPDPTHGGVLVVDNEEIGYTAAGMHGDTFSGVTRGIRGTSAAVHALGSLVGGGAPYPQSRINGVMTPVEDHPPDRHPFLTSAYNSVRHQLYQATGIVELNKKIDTWYMCLQQNAYCSAQDVHVWRWLHTPTTVGKADSAMTYDSDDDVMILYGGQATGSPMSDLWLLCFKADPQTSGNNVGCPSGRNYPDWVQLSSHSAPGPRLGHSLVYDSFHHHAVLFGGTDGSSNDPDSIWFYNPAKRAWTNPKPKGDVPHAFRRPAMAYDSKRHLIVLYEGPLGVTSSGIPGGLYTYDADANAWKLTPIQGGPVPSPHTTIAHGTMSMDYDPEHDVFVAVEQGKGGYALEAWELPGAALENTASSSRPSK